jgi:hypothetical protein
MTSSWKSAGGLTPFALSVFIAVGSGVGGLVRGEGLLFGLVCLGARGGGGNNWNDGAAMMRYFPSLSINRGFLGKKSSQWKQSLIV